MRYYCEFFVLLSQVWDLSVVLPAPGSAPVTNVLPLSSKTYLFFLFVNLLILLSVPVNKNKQVWVHFIISTVNLVFSLLEYLPLTQLSRRLMDLLPVQVSPVPHTVTLKQRTGLTYRTDRTLRTLFYFIMRWAKYPFILSSEVNKLCFLWRD